jgi:acyl-CoA thioesterase I
MMKYTFKKVNPVLILFLFSIMVFSAQDSGQLKGKIVCFGDSITYGASYEGNGWPEQLSKMSNNIVVVNAGRKGRKTSDKNELLPVIEVNKDADYFLFLLGVNDLKDGNDSLVNYCIVNMKWMIEKVKDEIPNAKIVLMAPCEINLKRMTELNRGKKYNENTLHYLIKLEDRYKKLAKEESVEFVSLFDIVSPGNLFDGIHPNVEGYSEITKKVWSELNKNDQ